MRQMLTETLVLIRINKVASINVLPCLGQGHGYFKRESDPHIKVEFSLFFY